MTLYCLLVLGSVVAEPYTKGDSHDYGRDAPPQGIVQPLQLLVVENLDHKDVKMDALHKLP